MNSLEALQKPIADILEQYKQQFDATLQSDNSLLQQAVEHLLQKKGKLVRPTLVFLSARLFGDVNQSVYDVALALELLHTASLVHDDVVDESDRRRGQASLNALMTNQIAVLVGDFILSRALHHAAQTGDAKVVDVVANLGQTLADGELLQLANLDDEKLDEASYYMVVRKKTASLFAVAAQLGVLTSGGSEEDAERMRRFGHLIGTCFQLRDDIFDYDVKNDSGKPAGNDMKEGKLTLPVIHAVNKTKNGEMLAKALKVRSGEATQKEIDELIGFTIDEGGIEYAYWAMNEFRMMADGLIDESRDPAIVESLHSLVNFVANRNY
ncbi:MAG: polyprenyl synthetase family protein [Bacteroidaceae bacterium]|nr:polyprenyl synthetase family protein [Bacteroidaceae bacterium]